MLNPSRRGVINAAGALALFAATSAAHAADEPTVSATWDLTDLYPSDAAWKAEYDRLSGEIPKLKALKGTLGQSAASLKNGLQYMSDINRATARLDVYVGLKGDLDTRSTEDQARRGVLPSASSGLSVAPAAACAARSASPLNKPASSAAFKSKIESPIAMPPRGVPPAGLKMPSGRF